MSTFLDLVNLARSEAGIDSSDLSTLQSGLNAESARFKSWVAREWLRLQAEHDDWDFLRTTFAFTTTASQFAYTPKEAGATTDGTSAGTSILSRWKEDSFRVSTFGSNYADEAILIPIGYDRFRNLYQFGNNRVGSGKPVNFAVRPSDRALCFGLMPSGQYDINGEFWRTPQELSADDDEPLMPAKFHDLVAFRALRAYGIYMAAPEVIGRADESIGRLYAALAGEQLPQFGMGPPLA